MGVSVSSKRPDSDLEERIRQNQGEIIFTLRHVIMPGEIIGGFRGAEPDDDFYYVQTGIIHGNIYRNKKHLEIKSPRGTIGLPGFEVGGPDPDKGYVSPAYYFFPIAGVPVKNLFSTNCYWAIERFSLPLELPERGFVLLESKHEKHTRSFGEDSGPYLKSFELVIGDGQVRDLFSKYEIRNVNQFVHLLKNPDKMRNRLEFYLNEKREEIAKDLVINVAKLVEPFRELDELRSKVLSSTLGVVSMEQDGERHYDWNNPGIDQQYLKLRNEVKRLTSKFERAYELGNRLDFKGKGIVSGESVGLTCSVPAGEYFDFVMSTIINPSKAIMLTCDKHLASQRGR